MILHQRFQTRLETIHAVQTNKMRIQNGVKKVLSLYSKSLKKLFRRYWQS